MDSMYNQSLNARLTYFLRNKEAEKKPTKKEAAEKAVAE
jgi:hypothetical protein